MKTRLLLLAIVSGLLVGCYPTSIVTTSPARVEPRAVAHTTVTVPRTHVVTQTTQVYADYDYCLGLDLQAVAAAFAQSATVREFEILLNNSSYMISNLDLNRDGYVDYLRVVEAIDHFSHYFVIQAVLAPNIFQDVATIVVDNPSLVDCYVEIIGDPFIYGPRYIVHPVFITRPAIYSHLIVRGYTPWISPWYWDYYPSHYRRPQPVYLTHYEAYVHTFIINHHYCHEVTYPTWYHNASYDTYTKSISRSDYSKQHPDQAFVTRTANRRSESTAATSNTSSPRVYNARDVRREQDATKETTTTTTARTTSRSANNDGNAATTSRTSTSSTSSRTANPSTSGNATTANPTRNTSTSTSTAAPTRSTTTREATTTTTSRSTSGTSTTTSRSSSGTSTATRSSNTNSTSGTTTVQSRVRPSGTANTSRSTSTPSSGSTRQSTTSGRQTTGTSRQTSGTSDGSSRSR